MRSHLIKQLSQPTEEETEILAGNKHIRKELYTVNDEFTVDSIKMLEKGQLIDIRTHTRFIMFPNHRHNYIEIMYMCAGKTEHIINEDRKITLETGDLLFLNQYSSHEILPARENDIGVNFIILPEFFDKILPMLEMNNPLSSFLADTLRHGSETAEFLHFRVADMIPVQNLIENLIWSLLYQQPQDNHFNQLTMGLLFTLLANAPERIVTETQEQSQDVFVMQVLKYIEDNYKNGTLEEISSKLNYSLSNASKRIKNRTGKTFKELLQEKRLRQAADMLRHTKVPVTDIIYQMGYDNTSYFHRIFRESYQMSPKHYRDMAGE